MWESYPLDARAAALYEEERVPAIFAPLAEATLRAFALPPGAFLDVACGTGVVARMVRERGGARRVVGLDPNTAMLDVARASRQGAAIEWYEGRAEAMPFASDTFSVLICQQGLQYFSDEGAALSEMGRVLAPGGLAVITVWCEVPPMFAALARALARHVDEATAERALAPFRWDDAAGLAQRAEAGGLRLLRESRITVERVLDAPVTNMVAEVLSMPYAEAVRARGTHALHRVVEETLAGLTAYLDGSILRAPQETRVFVLAAD